MPHPAFDLSGKVALVTGGNRGIGFGIAEGLAMAGAGVAIWGTSEAKNQAAAATLRGHGGQVEAFTCDVGDEAAVDATFARTLERFGRVDGCFANAGIAAMAPSFLQAELADLQRQVRVNLDGVFLTLRAASRHMMQRGGGGVLAVTSSIASIIGVAGIESYSATKGAVNAMARSLACEFAPHGIRVHAILPGFVETDMNAQARASEGFTAGVLAKIPAGRFGKPADFGGIAVYLMSDASSWHTGTEIVIDGGQSVQ